MLRADNNYRHLIKKILQHAACWILFIIYELILAYYISGLIKVTTIYFYFCNIGLFYVHAFILDNKLNRPKPAYLQAICFSLLATLSVMPIKAIGEYIFYVDKTALMHNPSLIRTFIVMDFARCIFYIGLSTLYWYRGNVAEFRKKSAEAAIRELRMARDTAELETSLAKTRNAYLQQQLNPHLIFNTLNFIYNTVYKTSEEGGKAVLLLAEILRFTLKDTDENGKIPLEAEIEQIENLIAINRFRFHYPLHVAFCIEGDTTTCRILPLILLTLVENMFKHGEFKDREIRISLQVADDGLLRFITENASRTQITWQSEKGIGLRNIRLRLDHAYPGHYTLDTGETKNIFHTALTVQL
jgi:two-component system LytT family sensor kinase